MQTVSPLLLSGKDVAQAAPALHDVIAIVEQTYRMEAAGKVDVPAKIGVHPRGSKSFLHAMPAYVGGVEAAGMKWVSFFPGNAERDLPDSTGIIVLNDPDSGVPVAIMEGMWITYARTSACAAVASKYLAKKAPRRLGLVGCGALAQWSLRALAAMHPSIEEVFVTSRRPETRSAFCTSAATQGSWRLVPVDDVRDAVEDMDIVVSSLPKLDVHPIAAAHLAPGTLLIPLDVTASWDDDTYAAADALVCDGIENLGRALSRYRPGLQVDVERTVALQDVVSGRKAGRCAPSDRIIAFVTGIASPDVALGWEILRRAQTMGLGLRFDFT